VYGHTWELTETMYLYVPICVLTNITVSVLTVTRKVFKLLNMGLVIKGFVKCDEAR